MKGESLSPMQQRFVDLYSGNATEAALKAGYSAKTAYSMGNRLLKKVEIIKAIKERETKEITPLIATRKDRQKFWTDVMSNPDEDMKNRLKASELLGKSEADFTEKIQATGTMQIDATQTIDLSSLTPDEIQELTRQAFGGAPDGMEGTE